MKATLLLLLLPMLALAQKPMKINGKDIGMVSFTYRNSFSKDMAKTLDTLQSQGITDMEFSSLFGKTAQEVRSLLDERGMKCSSFGVSMADALNKTDQVGENAKTLGASFVRVAWIPHTGPFTLEMAQKTAQEFNQIGKALKEKFDLTFCYHNHGFEFEPYGEGTLFDYLVQNTDPKFVSYEMDILWTFFPGQNPATLLEKYGNRFKLMHLKDLKKGVQGNMSGGTSVENDVALGTGQLNIPEIMKAAKKAKIQHYYLEDESSRYPVQTRQSRTYLSNLK
ncbi:sugar phosphate isomerase/epimerase family protein [Aquirufa ecclesiirivi]|uniref:sugar phosphate isomerase/epimerase family protein n=1 Tax=Aquirufa ecclesiirivi TaxID=2715124 RepID=UPI00140C0C81|nr:TIM barrel protein [Aquirufa ecclesiirivi]MCZ2471229.1 TIM barrel protein [Aquirufa ecclesiirivi]NHC50225.1 TIM barrel protein [Aquirufa ecclesiirivi]